MSGDPLTDRAAAEAFSTENKHKRAYSYQPTPKVRTHLRDGRPQCWGETTEHGRITRWSQCSSAGKVALADGSTWCGTHSPEGVAKRERKRHDRWAAERARADASNRAWLEERRIKEAFPRLLEALRQIERGHNDPRALAREVLADWPEEQRDDDAA